MWPFRAKRIPRWNTSIRFRGWVVIACLDLRRFLELCFELDLADQEHFGLAFVEMCVEIGKVGSGRSFQRQLGFILPLILIVSVVLLGILAVVMFSQKRQTDLAREALEVSRINVVNSRMNQILSAVHLCTCNLRDFVVRRDVNGKILPLQVLPADSTRTKFGFYKLDASSNCVGTGVIDSSDVVINVNENVDVNYKNALTANQVTLDNFKKDSNFVNPAYERYQANFIFSVQKRENEQRRARSNQAQPVSIDVFIELVTATNTIRKCYPPVNPPVKGECGPAAGSAFRDLASILAAGICTTPGGSTPPTIGGVAWTWTCKGSNGGSDTPCSANLRADGICGPANGGNFAALSEFSSQLCSSNWGNSGVAGNNPWTWSCNGLNGGVAVSCSSNQLVNGICGAPNGQVFANSSLANAAGPLCSAGNLLPAGASFTGAGVLPWSCSGLNSGSSASCSAVVSPAPMGIWNCGANTLELNECRQSVTDGCSGIECDDEGKPCTIGSTTTTLCRFMCYDVVAHFCNLGWVPGPRHPQACVCVPN